MHFGLFHLACFVFTLSFLMLAGVHAIYIVFFFIFETGHMIGQQEEVVGKLLQINQ